MSIVLLQTDAFAEGFGGKARGASNTLADSMEHEHFEDAGRPAGVILKAPSRASLSVVMANGEVLPLTGNFPWGPHGKKNRATDRQASTDFMLQSVQESRKEKVQFVQTFGDDYTFFYGEAPRILTCAGVLLNSRGQEWRAWFWHNYDKYFRGTKLTENNARVYLQYDDILVQGYMLAASARDNANQPYQTPFSFTMLVSRYIDVGLTAPSPYDGEKAGDERLSAREGRWSIPGKGHESFGFADASETGYSGRMRGMIKAGEKARLNRKFRRDAARNSRGDPLSFAEKMEQFLRGNAAGWGKTAFKTVMAGGGAADVARSVGADIGTDSFGELKNRHPATQHLQPLATAGATGLANGNFVESVQNVGDPRGNRMSQAMYADTGVSAGDFKREAGSRAIVDIVGL